MRLFLELAIDCIWVGAARPLAGADDRPLSAPRLWIVIQNASCLGNCSIPLSASYFMSASRTPGLHPVGPLLAGQRLVRLCPRLQLDYVAFGVFDIATRPRSPASRSYCRTLRRFCK
jgi:hypothetical protein